jgi:hypothetical protein
MPLKGRHSICANDSISLAHRWRKQVCANNDLRLREMLGAFERANAFLLLAQHWRKWRINGAVSFKRICTRMAPGGLKMMLRSCLCRPARGIVTLNRNIWNWELWR